MERKKNIFKKVWRKMWNEKKLIHSSQNEVNNNSYHDFYLGLWLPSIIPTFGLSCDNNHDEYQNALFIDGRPTKNHNHYFFSKQLSAHKIIQVLPHEQHRTRKIGIANFKIRKQFGYKNDALC